MKNSIYLILFGTGIFVVMFIIYTLLPTPFYKSNFTFDGLEKEKKRIKSDKFKSLLDDIIKGPLEQNDTRVINYILKNNYFHPPSILPYNLIDFKNDPSVGQSTIILHALNKMKNGWFVECGGLDGEVRSNTLVLERDYGWKGLLIEADPKNFKLLLKKNRKAWSINACLATKPYSHMVIFKQHFNTGRIANSSISRHSTSKILPAGYTQVQCFPFFTILSALNISMTIDYFSLDIEGSELEVLKTIPFDSIFIKVLSVEYIHNTGGRSAVKSFMLSKGFQVFGEVKDPRNLANDLIFVNQNFNFFKTDKK